jgi:hypothetical protein
LAAKHVNNSLVPAIRLIRKLHISPIDDQRRLHYRAFSKIAREQRGKIQSKRATHERASHRGVQLLVRRLRGPFSAGVGNSQKSSARPDRDTPRFHPHRNLVKVSVLVFLFSKSSFLWRVADEIVTILIVECSAHTGCDVVIVVVQTALSKLRSGKLL